MGRRKIRHSKCGVRKRWEDGKSVIQNVALGKGEEEENPPYEFWHFKEGLGRPKIRHASCAARKAGEKCKIRHASCAARKAGEKCKIRHASCAARK